MKNLIILHIVAIYPILSYAGNYTIDTIRINSDTLQESRDYLIFIPEGVRSTDSVTLVYMVDGEFSSYRYQAISNMKTVNAVIGIGIMNTDRRRELLALHNADIFLEFIARELIPFVEKDFTVQSRILYGHSFGGAFSIYAILHKPGLFNRYIASSPTPIMEMTDSTIYLELDSTLDKEIKFYFSHGSKDKKQVRKWCGRLYTHFSEIILDRIEWKYEIFDEENHNSSDVVSLQNGLNF